MSGGLQGLRAWIVQRFTAVFIVVYIVYALGYLIVVRPDDFAAWSAWLHAGGAMALLTALFFLAVLLHAWVGGRDIILDYVHCLALRLGLLFGLVVFLFLCALWTFRALVTG